MNNFVAETFLQRKMKIKGLIISLISSFIMLTATMSCSTEPDNEIEVGDSINILLNRQNTKNPTKRPNAPGIQQIFCDYNGETLSIDFAVSEGQCELKVTDKLSEKTHIYNIDSSTLHADIEAGKMKVMHIELQTERGYVYTGTIIR